MAGAAMLGRIRGFGVLVGAGGFVFMAGAKRVLVKLHERAGPGGVVSRVLAVCDEGLVGRVFKRGDAVLDLRKYAAFYSGRAVGVEEAAEMMKNTDNVNVVGETAVGAAKKALEGKGTAKRIAGVPHLQVYRI